MRVLLALLAFVIMPLPAIAGAKQDLATAVLPMKTLGIRVSEPYAIAHVFGNMEGQTEYADWLLKHFSFGWQRIGYSPDHFPTCYARRFGLTAQQIHALALKSADNRYHYCNPGFTGGVDRGPTRDVESVRALMQSYWAVPSVHVSGNAALAEFGPPGGGSRVFQKKAGRWKLLGGGGGMIDAGIIQGFGISPTDARALVRP